MSGITWIHIAGGMVALATGAVAFTVRKGGRAHVLAGIAFAVSMLVLGATASYLSPLRSPPDSPVGGIMVCYFAATGWMAARRRSGTPGRFEKLACVAVLIVAAAIIGKGIQLALAPPAPVFVPPGPVGMLVLGSICLLSGVGDLRWILRGSLSAVQRITRHLWRMCFAFFIATGSFFLGQQDVLPEAVRGSPVLIVLAFAPFGLMLYWLVRVRVSRRKNPAKPTEAITGT